MESLNISSQHLSEVNITGQLHCDRTIGRKVNISSDLLFNPNPVFKRILQVLSRIDVLIDEFDKSLRDCENVHKAISYLSQAMSELDKMNNLLVCTINKIRSIKFSDFLKQVCTYIFSKKIQNL